GEATAKAARVAGLDVVAVGRGTLQPVVDTIPAPHRRLLRLAGRERITLAPPPGATIVERILYASDALPMPPDLACLLGEGAVVMLHSAVAARHFAAQCDLWQVARQTISLACIGPRVAIAAGSGWRACKSAAEASDSALLAMSAELCQDCAASKRRTGKS
ncbi:MAG: uroporphyrinogen-III synthase, partial [Novosphingobium sp.]